MLLSGKHAVVTGGGSGIGLAITRALVNVGATVTIMGRNKDRLDKAASENDRIHAISVDVTDQKSVAIAVKKAAETLPISILVNNAGAAYSAPFHKTGFQAWKDTLAVNLDSVFLMTQAVLEQIKSMDHGRVINIASIAGLEGCAYTSAYSAAKHGVIGLTKSLALELTNGTTTINAICPAFTNTDIVTDSIKNIMEKTGRTREEALKEILKIANQKRLVEPEEIASEVIKLCDPASDDVNGTAVVIDGN